MSFYIYAFCRFWLAGLFLVFGLDGFFHFLPMPAQTPKMTKAIEALFSLQFILPTAKVIEILSGLLLLFNWMPRLALVLLLPLVFGIFCIQMLFNRANGKGITLVIVIPFIVMIGLQANEFFEFLTSH